MKSTCIQHPTNEPLLVIRQWQLDFCGGNHCAGALLSFFEYWHNLRLEISQRARPANRNAQQHGKPATQDESLLQFHSDEQLQAGLLDLYGTKKIREGRRLLVTKGAITEHPNPNPRYAFDKTLYFEFHPEVINAWLDQRRNPAPPDQNALSGDDITNNVTFGKNAGRVGKNADSYTETTTETTTEITTTTPNPSSFTERAAEPEAVERGGSGVRDENRDSASDHGTAAPEASGEKPVSGEEVQAAATTGERGDTSTENPETANDEEAPNERRPGLAYPAKLTERERDDIAQQVCLLPLVIAQQMLDVVQSQIQGGQIKKNPAAVLRGIVRKYRADPAAFDPSPGFGSAEARRRRAETEARARAEVERRARAREAVQASPIPNAVARQSIAAMLRGLRGH